MNKLFLLIIAGIVLISGCISNTTSNPLVKCLSIVDSSKLPASLGEYTLKYVEEPARANIPKDAYIIGGAYFENLSVEYKRIGIELLKIPDKEEFKKIQTEIEDSLFEEAATTEASIIKTGEFRGNYLLSKTYGLEGEIPLKYRTIFVPENNVVVTFFFSGGFTDLEVDKVINEWADLIGCKIV